LKQGTSNEAKRSHNELIIMIYSNAKRAWEHLQQEKSLNGKVYVPKVYDEYTSKRVLVCEWVDGVQLTDTRELKNRGLDYKEAMKISVEAFSSQIFRTGFVHGTFLSMHILVVLTFYAV
jgi:tRNA A-37 threonylcarbamoyl transferase component Bud32